MFEVPDALQGNCELLLICDQPRGVKKKKDEAQKPSTDRVANKDAR